MDSLLWENDGLVSFHSEGKITENYIIIVHHRKLVDCNNIMINLRTFVDAQSDSIKILLWYLIKFIKKIFYELN